AVPRLGEDRHEARPRRRRGRGDVPGRGRAARLPHPEPARVAGRPADARGVARRQGKRARQGAPSDERREDGDVRHEEEARAGRLPRGGLLGREPGGRKDVRSPEEVAMPQWPDGEFLVPLFPLPNLVFFPQTRMPLHIFEPRYRQMIADAVAGEMRFGIVLLRPGWEDDYFGAPAVHPWGTLTIIEQAMPLDDGR